MANRIRLDGKTPPVPALQMSNGLTDVFLEVLARSASRLARTEGEHRLARWFQERDQAAMGAGTVGFDLRELPWSRRTFPEDRAFLLRAVSGARARLGWEDLGYAPNEALLFPCLSRFAAMLTALEAWDLGTFPTRGERCP